MNTILFTMLLAACAPTAFAQQMIVAQNNEPVDPNGPLTYAIKNNEVWAESGGVSFKPNSAEILPSSTRTLKTIKKFLDDKSYISTLRVEGHVSCGDKAQALSEARALAVCQWLVKAGVDCKRLMPVGFGCNKPITDMHNEMNTRITFANAALKGHAIGGMPLDGGGKVAGDACAQ